MIKLFTIGSDDDNITHTDIDQMPTVSEVPADATEFQDEFYQTAYDLGYRTFGTEDEEVFLVKSSNFHLQTSRPSLY